MSHRLAEQYPESSEYSEHGNEIHEAMAAGLMGRATSMLPEVRAAVSAILEEFDVLGVEVPLVLVDPETGEEITRGTADVVARCKSDGVMTIVDHKTGRPERVTPAHDSLQLHAYGLAAAFRSYEVEYKAIVSHIVDGKFWFGAGCAVAGEQMWSYLNRIKRAVATASMEPATAYRGGHCDGCFQQKHCPSFMLPAFGGPTALEPFTKPDGLTRDNAVQALRVVEAMKAATNVADERLRAYVREFGAIVDGDREWSAQVVNGRRSGPTVKECEERGLHDLIKAGRPMERFGWRKRS